VQPRTAVHITTLLLLTARALHCRVYRSFNLTFSEQKYRKDVLPSQAHRGVGCGGAPVWFTNNQQVTGPSSHPSPLHPPAVSVLPLHLSVQATFGAGSPYATALAARPSGAMTGPVPGPWLFSSIKGSLANVEARAAAEDVARGAFGVRSTSMPYLLCKPRQHASRLWRALLPTHTPIVAALIVSCMPRIQFRKCVAFVVQVIGVLIVWLHVTCRMPKRMTRMVWR
jgi:hypothetical protein